MTTVRPIPPASLTPLSGVTTWLVAVAFVLAAGLALAAAAAAFAIASGLPVDQAVRLLSDPRASPLITSPSWIAAMIVVNELAVAAALFLSLRRLKLGLRQIAPLARPTLLELFGALLLVFGLAPAAELCAELVHRYLSRDLTSEQVVLVIARGSSPAGFALVLVVFSVLPALVEEALFRGVVLRSFERYGALVSVAVTSLLFGALHLEPTQVAGTIVLGLAFGLARWHTGSLLPSVLSHGVYNAAVMLAERFIAPGERHELAPGRAALGALAAAFGWWLISGRRPRSAAL